MRAAARGKLSLGSQRRGVRHDLLRTGHIDMRGDQDTEPGYHGRDQVRQRHAVGEIAEGGVAGGGEEGGRGGPPV